MSGAVLLPEFLSISRSKAEPPPSGVPSSEARPALDWDRFIGERLEAGSTDLYADSLAHMERQLLTRVLQRTGGNQVRAAEVLGITRGSLRHKLRSLGITVERSVCTDDDPDD